MSRLCFFTAAALAATAAAMLATLSTAADRPQKANVILILADDFGWMDLGCYGHPYARTPNIDRLAAEGTRFQQFYSTGATCCPARTGIMTSKFPASYGRYPDGFGFGDRVTITELLKRSGYKTGHVGKWHIGPKREPGTYGIDTIGSEGRTDRSVDLKKVTRGRDAPIFDAAISFVEEHKAGPFYLNVWTHISHHPIMAPDAYVRKFEDLVLDQTKFAVPMQDKFANCKKRGGDVSEHMRRYLADVNSMDDDVGRLLHRLDELGLRENTIVVFSSDQGPAPLGPEVELRGKGDSNDMRLNAMGYVGPLRGGKHTYYEGGARVPGIIRWPGHVPAGRVDADSVIGGIDWLPTLCGITGISIDLADFDGEDVSDAWLGSTHTRNKPLFWKRNAARSEMVIRSGQWKLFRPFGKRGELELFDIIGDPGETNNLAAERPEVVKRLAAQLDQWDSSLPREYSKAADRGD